MPIKIDPENMLCPGSEYDPGKGSVSAPGSRSNSWKSRHRGSLRSNRDKRHSNLTRTNSHSTPDCSDTQNFKRKTSGGGAGKDCPLGTVLSFKTTSKGIINSGSFNKSLSSNSLFSSGSLAVTGGGSCSNISSSRSTSVDRIQKGIESSQSLNASCAFTVSYFRTLVLGAPGVGKSSLVRHLTRSLSTSSTTDDDLNRQSSVDPVVTVELDGQESTMEFVDGPEISDLEHYRADAFIIVFAVSELQSFISAVSLLNHLRQDLGTDRPIYVVANKTDLVRQRLVSTQDAKNSLSALDCHFLEISTALNVNLDQLIVGVLCRIKEQLTPLGFHDLDPLSIASLARKRRSSPGALAAISNFLKHACKREHRGRNSMPVMQLV